MTTVFKGLSQWVFDLTVVGDRNLGFKAAVTVRTLKGLTQYHHDLTD